MAGNPSGGQKLTPNPNVVAPAGRGGDIWGANGGGVTPIGGGVSGQTGWDAPLQRTWTDGETQTNVESANARPVMADTSSGAKPVTTFDDSLTVPNNAG